MKRTFIPSGGSLLVFLIFSLAGNLFAQNYQPSAGSDTTLYYPSDGITSISDPGGPGGSSTTAPCNFTGSTANNYPNCNCHTIIRICPDVAGKPIRLDFSQFGVVNPDYFIVYNGDDTTAAVLYNNSSNGANSNDRCYGPRLVQATNPGGCITVRLFANASTNEVGFLASVSIPDSSDAGIAAVLPDGAATAGSNNVQVQVRNHGLKAISNVTVEWSLAGVAQTPFNYVGSIAPGQTSPFFTIGTANVAGGETLRVWTSMPNGVADTQNGNDTLQRQLCVAMAGNYTIDHNLATGGNNYATFTAAIAAMVGCGVSGPVVFNVAPGTYTEQVTVPSIVGASAANTITFRSTSTDSTQVKVQWPTASTAAGNFVLTLTGARYVTFEKLTFERTSGPNTYQTIAELTNGALNNSFLSCQFIAPQPTATGTFERRTSLYAAVGALHNGTTVRNSYFSGNAAGIWAEGIANVSGDFTIENNTFLNSYTGITLTANRNVVVANNRIERLPISATTAYFGVTLRWVSGGSITSNRIATQAGGENGIRLREVLGTAGNPFLIANNFVQVGGTATGKGQGIALEDGNSYIDIVFNSVNVIGGNATTGRAFNFEGSPNTNVRLLNNNLANDVLGYSIYVDGASAVNALTSDYNNLFTNGSVLGYWNGTTANNLPLLRLASGKDVRSISVDPNYTSFSDLHTAVGALNGAATPFAGITTDIDGDVRDPQRPDIGADEFVGAAVDAGVVQIINPPYPAGPGTYNLDVEIGNFGTTTLTSATIQWQYNGLPQPDVPYTGSLATGETDTVTLSSITPGSGDAVKVWTSLPNGVADADNSNDTLNTTLCISLLGTYTIDKTLPTGAGNFASFTEAATALGNCGVSGPVVFNVVTGNGPFTEQVTIPVILGVSAVNTVTFNCFGDTLQFDTPTADRYVLRLNGAKYVTFDSLYIRTLSVSFGYGIMFSGDASYNTIRKSHIDLTAIGMSSTSGNTSGIVFSAAPNSLSSDGNNGSYNLIENNILRYGLHGVRLNAGGSKGNRIVGNIMLDHHASGVYILAGNDSTLVEGNDISRPTRTNTNSTFIGVDMTGVSQNCLIKGNVVHNTHPLITGSNSVYAFNTSSTVDATVGNENVFVNNLAYDLTGGNVAYGFYNNGSDGAHYFHNTVVIDNQNVATGGAAKGFNQSGEGHNIKIIGNIFYVTRSGTNGFKSAVTYGSTNSTIESDYNVFYVNTLAGATVNLGQYGTSGLFADLVGWQQLGFDLNSYQVDPFFVDRANEDFTPQNPFFNDVLANLGFNDDLYGDPRGPKTDPGAIEFEGLPNDVGVLSYHSPTIAVNLGTQNVTVDVRNYGINTVNSFDVSWSVNSALQGTVPNSTTLAPSDTSAPINLGTFNAVGGDTIRAWTSNPNGGADGFPLNDTLTLVTCIGLSGNYTINAGQPTGGTNFVSFQAAIDSMRVCGIAGPVVFDIVQGSGPYTEQPVVPFINGVSATNTITFQGHGDTLQFTPTASLKYVLKFNGAKHVILDNLYIRPQAFTAGYGILLGGGSDNVTIRNSTIDLSLIAATSGINSAGLVISGSNSSTSTNAPLTASNTLFENNRIVFAVQGITVIGHTDGSGAVNNRFINNTIEDFYTDAFNIMSSTGTVARNNDISRPTRTGAGSALTGFRIEGGARSALIDGNRVHNLNDGMPTGTTSMYPIFVTSNDVPVGQEVLVVNNLIYNINGNGLLNAIYNLGSDGNFIYNNTVVLDHTSATGTGLTRGIWQSSTADNIKIKNNIIYITRGTSGDKWGVHLNAAATTNLEVDHNVYYINGAGGNNYIGYYAGTATSYPTLAGWQTANNGAFDQNGFNRDPRFLDVANDDYTPTAPAIDNEALPVGLLTDINGNPRSATTPDPGAIEFSPLNNDAGIVELISPLPPFAPGTYPITAVVQNFGILDITDVDIYVNINDGTNSVTLPVYNFGPVSIPTNGLDTATIGSYNFTGGSYTITIWTENPNGGADANITNDTLVVNVCIALPAGNYTIDAGAPASASNFQSFGAAAEALRCGILGSVVFDVVAGSGPYSEQVTLLVIPGTSASATVTFNGNGNTLTHNGTVKFATLLLNGSDWVTLRDLTVSTTSFAQGFGIQLMNQANHNTIRNVTVLADEFTTNVANYGIVASSSELLATGDGNNANHLWIDSVTVRGGYGGIRLEGASGILLTGNRITNSTVLKSYNVGIYMDDADSVLLAGNYVDSLRDATNGDGVVLFDMNGYFEVSGNRIYGADVAIQINDGNTSNTTGRSRIVNNFFHSPSDYGLWLDASERIDVFHNTVVGTIALRMASNATGYDIRNNIFYGLTSFAFDNAVPVANTSFVNLNYNLYYSNGVVVARYGGTSAANDYGTLAQWRAAFPTLNQNSLYGDPVFASAKDFHLLGTIANDMGDNSVGVTVDIDGDARPMGAAVDIGADEYTPFTSNIQVVSIIEPLDNTCGDSATTISVVLYNQGTQPQGNFDIRAEVTGATTQTVSTTYVGPIAPLTYDTVAVGTFNSYAGGTFHIFVEHLLGTDQYPVNDTLSITLTQQPIPAAPVTVGDTGCVGSFLELTANMAGFADIEWFDDAGLTNSVGGGDVFFTPALNATTTYYAVGYQGVKERLGIPARTGTSNTGIIVTPGWGLEFGLTEPLLLDSVTVYPNGSGTITLAYYDLNNGNVEVAATQAIPVAGNGNTPVQIRVGWLIQPGRYSVGVKAATGLANLGNQTGASYPYTPPTLDMQIIAGKLGFNLTSSTSYYWFFDWVVRRPGCTSPAAPVTAFISNITTDAGPDDTICAGETATLTAQNGVAWNWSNGQTTQTINVTPTSTITYSLTATDALGCPGTVDQVTVVVNALPTVTASNDTTACSGEAVTLSATGAATYAWSSGQTTASITVTAGGAYTVTGTNSNGCSNTDVVVFNELPLPSGNAGADVTICEGGSTDLLASSGVDYVWSTGATTAEITVSPVTTTSYGLTTTDQFGCVGTDTVTVTVNALPTLTITVSDTICISQTSVALTATPAGGTFTGPGVTAGVFDASLVGAGTYTLTYSYTDGNGCSNTATKQVVVSNAPSCTPGIGSLNGIEIAGVYPNPFHNKVNIEFVAASNQPVTISMYNLLGQTIFTAEVEVVYGLNTYTIDTDRSLAEGFYVIELRKGDEAYKEKLLRVR